MRRTRTPILALLATAALALAGARADAQRAGRQQSISLESLRAACVNAATSAGYAVVGRSQETRSGDAYSAILQLRNNVRTADYTCTTDARGATRIPGITDAGSGYGGGYGGSTSGNGRDTRDARRGTGAGTISVAAQRDRARSACAAAVTSRGRGYQNARFDAPVRRNDGSWDVAFRGPGNGNARGVGNRGAGNAAGSCRWDPSTDRATLY